MALLPTLADAPGSGAANGEVIRLLSSDGTPVAAFTEWMPALIQVAVPLEQWSSVTLTIQGLPAAMSVRTLQGRPRIVAEWPRSGTGHYELRLAAGEANATSRITILPHKISESAYEAMLEDLESRLPATVAIALQRAGALAGITLPPPGETTLAQELQRLRTAVNGTAARPGLAAVLVDVARDPHRVLQTEELWERQERARRPHPTRLAQALVRANNLDAGKRPLMVVDDRVEEDVNVYENRLLLEFFHQVDVRLRRLLRALEAIHSHGLYAEALALSKSLRQARQQASFLDDVRRPSHLATPLTMVLLKRPPYRAALEGFLAFHRRVGVRLEHPGLDAPLENLPSLYQTWGTLQVLSTLLEVAAEHGYRVVRHRLAERDATGLYVRVLPDGQPAMVLHHPEQEITVSAIPERSFKRHSGEIRSISYTQRPDIAVEVRRPGEPAALYLFDPKYKLDGEADPDDESGQPTKVDIDKMHAYRDAIRDGENERVVRSASILYPGPFRAYGQEIMALPAYPSREGVLLAHVRRILRVALASPEPLHDAPGDSQISDR